MRTSWPSLLIFLGLIKTSSQLLSTNSTTCDLSKEFDCGDGICLPKAWKCDNVTDCHNRADEVDCEPKECPEGDYKCRRCMEKKSEHKCDGIPDCAGGSDEKYCEYNSRRPNVATPFNFGDPSLYIYDGFDKNGCLPGFGYCSSQKICIPTQSFCDGKLDCHADTEDERNCTRDEKTGISMWYPSENPCKSKFVCKTNETSKDEVCIQMEELCNGKKDCPLGDDESEKCSECSTKHCEYQCKNTPTGAKCECAKGYRLDSDGSTCVDLDECTLPERACQHFCQNHVGSFRCSCAKGYYLKADGKSCESSDTSKGSLLLGLRDEIEERPLEDFSGTNFTSVFHKLNGSIQAFDYFHRGRKLFIVTCDDSRYLCHNGNLVVKEDGKPSKVLRENVFHSLRLAVDWIGGNIFFSEIVPKTNNATSATTRISVCTMDGKFCRGIIESKEASMMSNFAIHPMRGLVFYADKKEKNGVAHIMMANMDGSQQQVLLETNSSIMSLTIDYSNHDIYFRGYTHIHRVNIDTKKTAVIARKIQQSLGDSLVFHNRFLYAPEFYTHLQFLDVTRENAPPHLLAPIDAHLGHMTPHLAVNDSSHQLEPSAGNGNPCRDLECPWICVIVPGFTAKCLCPDGYTLSILGSTCIPNPLETVEQELSFKSYPGFEVMSEYCKSGVGCLNGGSCREVLNKTRIVCDCLEPYDGLYCERRKPILSDGAVLIIIPVVILLLILSAIGCWFFFVYRRNKKNGDVDDTISIVSKYTGAVYYENDAVSLG